MSLRADINRRDSLNRKGITSCMGTEPDMSGHARDSQTFALEQTKFRRNRQLLRR